METSGNPRRRIARIQVGIVTLAIGLALFVRFGRDVFHPFGQQLRLLKVGEPHERGAALFELVPAVAMDPDRVVPAIIVALADDDDYVRGCAAKVLGSAKLLPPWDLKSSAALVPLLEDHDGRTIGEAALSLAQLEGDPETVVPALVRASGLGPLIQAGNYDARSQPGAVPEPGADPWKAASRYAAFEALIAYATRGDDAAYSAVLGQVHHPDPRFRIMLAEAVDRWPADDHVDAVLLELSRDMNPSVLEKVIPSLVRHAMGERDEGRAAFDSLLRLAEATNHLTRMRAIEALGSLTESEQTVSGPAVKALLRLAQAPDLETRRRAIRSLGNAGRYFPEVFPILEHAFRTGELKDVAAEAIAIIAPSYLPPDFDPLEEIRSGRAALRYLATLILDRSKAVELAALLIANRDEDESVRREAGHSILIGPRSRRGSGGGPLNIAAAEKEFSAPAAVVETRKLLLQALSGETRNPKGNPAALEAICRAVVDQDAEIRKMVVQMIRPASAGFPRNDFKLVQKALYFAFRDQEQAVRSISESALGEYVNLRFAPGTFDPRKSIAGEEPGERFVAVSMLDAKKPDEIVLLIDATRDTDPRIRRRAAMTLQRIEAAGPQTVEVLGALTAASRDPDAGVRDAASRAKAAIQASTGQRSGM